MICINTSPHSCTDMKSIIIARFTAVEYAIIFFTSLRDPFRLMITMPTTLTKIKKTGIDHKDAIYNLATTIVEECNNEDTGVGPSMAIGNQ